MHGNEDFLYKLELILMYIKEMISFQKDAFSRQEEMFALLNSMHTNFHLERIPQDVWLTKADVMDELCITESTFYRRLRERKWERRKSGGTWYYLKSSLV